MIIDLGKVAITLGGNWSNNQSYEALTAVLYRTEDGGDGCGYIAKKSNIAVPPGSDESVWEKIVQTGASIYQLAVKYGYVGTEEQFVAAYNAAVQAAVDAAGGVTALEEAVAAAEATRVAAEQARANAETSRANAEAARQNAEAGRVSAETSRVNAETARQNASATAVAAANTAAALATEKAALANQKAELANQKAALAAEKAALANEKAGKADAAADRCTELNDHPMRINSSTFHWEIWDEENDEYVDTGIMATGSPYATFEVNQSTGQLVCTTDNTYCGPDFSLNESTGELILTI